jgi:ribosomal protein S18 acetylase RimI-like enzyme
MIIRPLNDSDDLNELTALLHLAYKKLADQGFRFLATYQDVAKTRERLKDAECFVAMNENKMVGTVTYYSQKNTYGNEWYDQPFISTFGMLAVDPAFQRIGLGEKLMAVAEELAVRDQAKEITIDTAEGARELIDYYKKRGYRFVGYAQWDVTNYRSVMLSKQLY